MNLIIILYLFIKLVSVICCRSTINEKDGRHEFWLNEETDLICPRWGNSSVYSLSHEQSTGTEKMLTIMELENSDAMYNIKLLLTLHEFDANTTFVCKNRKFYYDTENETGVFYENNYKRFMRLSNSSTSLTIHGRSLTEMGERERMEWEFEQRRLVHDRKLKQRERARECVRELRDLAHEREHELRELVRERERELHKLVREREREQRWHEHERAAMSPDARLLDLEMQAELAKIEYAHRRDNCYASTRDSLVKDKSIIHHYKENEIFYLTCVSNGHLYWIRTDGNNVIQESHSYNSMSDQLIIPFVLTAEDNNTSIYCLEIKQMTQSRRKMLITYRRNVLESVTFIMIDSNGGDTGAWVGAVVGVLIFVTAVFLCCWRCCRKKKAVLAAPPEPNAPIYEEICYDKCTSSKQNNKV